MTDTIIETVGSKESNDMYGHQVNIIKVKEDDETYHKFEGYFSDSEGDNIKFEGDAERFSINTEKVKYLEFTVDELAFVLELVEDATARVQKLDKKRK